MKKALLAIVISFLATTSCAMQHDFGLNSLYFSSMSESSERDNYISDGGAPYSFYYLNVKCENERGESLTITNYYIENNIYFLDSCLCINSLKDLYVPYGHPACLAFAFSGTLNDNIFYNEDITFATNKISHLADDSFEGAFTFAFSIKNINDINYPLYFRFFIKEKGVIESNFVIR